MRYQSRYIVSDEHRFVYFVVQKVACTSIKSALLPLFDVLDDNPEFLRRDGSPEIHKTFAASGYQIKKRPLLRKLDGKYRDYFKFAFVRNPWDRLVSCYLQKFTPGGKGLVRQPEYEGARLYVGMPFAEFVEAVHKIPDEEANPHFRSQHVSLCNPEGEVMADFVGRFERLEKDFAYVTKKIGAAETIELPHKLSSPGRESRHFTDFYDKRLASLVHERFQRDIETFDYSF